MSVGNVKECPVVTIPRSEHGCLHGACTEDVRAIVRFEGSHQVEAHRIQAGRWISKHAPKEARIATGFGLPAYFSQRHIHDWSSLTEELPSDQDFYGATDPDYIATCEFQSGATRESYQPPKGYEVLKFFGPSRLPDYSVDFFMIVLGRGK